MIDKAKPARLSILITPSSKAALAVVCSKLDMTASQVVRQLVRAYLDSDGRLPLASGRKRVPN